MKIQIELQDRPNTFDDQMKVVDQYIKDNTLESVDREFMGLVMGSDITIKESWKGQATKITLPKSLKEFYVSCKKTKGGMYKFKVWRA